MKQLSLIPTPNLPPFRPRALAPRASSLAADVASWEAGELLQNPVTKLEALVTRENRSENA
jgi:hypothetical protein